MPPELLLAQVARAWSLYEDMVAPAAAEDSPADKADASMKPSTAPNADTFNLLIAVCAKVGAVGGDIY